MGRAPRALTSLGRLRAARPRPRRCRRRRPGRAPARAGAAPAAAGACRRTPGRAPGGRTSRTAGCGLGRQSPVSSARPDRLPDRLDLALGGEQVGLVGLVAQHLAVAEVDQLEHRRDDAAGAPDDERVELHLEQRLGLEPLAGRRARSCSRRPGSRRRGRRRGGRRSRAAAAWSRAAPRRRARARPARGGAGPRG